MGWGSTLTPPRLTNPSWTAATRAGISLVTESLSYCYEGLGNFKKAAEVLKPAAEQADGPLKTEIMRRLAMLYDKAKEPKEAAVYWRKLLEKPPDAALVPYLQEKLAAAEAGARNKGRLSGMPKAFSAMKYAIKNLKSPLPPLFQRGELREIPLKVPL